VIPVFSCGRFGLPFVLHLEKTVAWDLLQKEILEKMKYFLRPTVCIQVWKCFAIPAGCACVPSEETVTVVECDSHFQY
jgi:hypothetical protein